MAPAAHNESLPGEPTNLQRRQNADEDTENRNNSGDRRAENIRAYHEGQIAELQKEINVHQAIVDQQDKILSGELDANTPLPAGTDIGAKFNQGEEGSDERPPATVNELKSKRKQERDEREGNDNSSTFNDTSDEFDPTSVNPDDKSPEDKSGDDENDKRRKVAEAGGQKAISDGEGEFEGSRPENNPDGGTNSTDGGTNSNDPEPTNTPATPVDDNAPQQDENKLNDATNPKGDGSPVSKTPTPPPPSPKRNI